MFFLSNVVKRLEISNDYDGIINIEKKLNIFLQTNKEEI